jgi:O-antigen/teichoic acid export membrane protein
MLITRTVSVEDYGVFTAVMSFVMILGAYNDFGMTDSLNYFLPGHIHDKNARKITQTFSIAFVTQLCSTTLLALLLYFGSGFLAAYYFKNPLSAMLLHIFIPYFFIDNFFRLLSTFFLAIQDTKLQKWVEFLRNICQVSLIFGIAFLSTPTIQKYVFAYNISAICGIIFALFFIIRKYRGYFTWSGVRFSQIDYWHIFKYAIFVMFSANIGTLLGQIDSLMITGMLGTTANGIYNIYLAMARIPFLFLLPWVFFLMPVFSDLMKRWEDKKVITIHAFCYELFTIIALMMTSFFILFGDTLTLALFGAWYEMSGRILLYSAPFLIFNFLMQVDFQILSASGRPRTKMYILLAGVALNVITNYIFIRLWGVVGSAFASGIGWVFIWMLTFHQTRHYASTFRWSIFWQNVVGFLLLSWWLSTIHLESFLQGNRELMFGIFVIIALYGLVFIALNWSEFRRFQRIFRAKHLT